MLRIRDLNSIEMRPTMAKTEKEKRKDDFLDV